MKIATMVRSYIPWPRPADMNYAPIDVALTTARGLGQRGHEVTIFAPEGSQISGPGLRLETRGLQPLTRTLPELEALLDRMDLFSHGVPFLRDHYYASDMYARAAAGEYDIVHFHHPETGLTLGRNYPQVPAVHTLHDPIADWKRELFALYAEPNQHYISLSHNQRKDAPELNYLATVYNGTDPEHFSFGDGSGDYLLFAGTVMDIKGTKEAVEVAVRTGSKLLICGAITHNGEGYFDQYVKPFLGDDIRYLGPVAQDQLVQYYQNAKAFLTPVQREEPFGLTTIEAMSCGTPVISLRRGAAPEIIEDGVSGFIVDDVEAMADAVGKVCTVDRRACRQRVQRHFTLETMVDGYEQAYQKLLES